MAMPIRMDRLRFWRASWRDLMGQLAPRCGYGHCVHSPNLWRRLRRRSRGVRMQGTRYCQAECLEWALIDLFGRARSAQRRGAAESHRIPLGLLLLSREQLSAEQLRTALGAQRSAGHRKLGEWLQELGYASEFQVTAALARQWSCPVLRTASGTIGASRVLPIPAPLLESFQMMPVELVEATGTLLMAFSEGIDYTVLYAIEQMLGYRTEACLVCPSILRKSLQTVGRQREASDIVFERMEGPAECARIVSNYCAKVAALEVRVARCGEHVWIRLEGARQKAVNLVLRVPEDHSTSLAPLSAAAAV